MRILIPMTYFRPYLSGPITYVANLATELVARGHDVTILTTQHDSGLARRERLATGVEVVRVPVVARISKGVVAPTFTLATWREVGRHDATLVQVPQLEAPALAAVCKLRRRVCMLMYHCDVELPPGRLNRIIERCLNTGHGLAARWSSAIAASTRDYAEHSRVMSRYLDRVHVVPQALDAVVSTESDAAAFRARHGLGDRPLVGMCARLSREKGFERLLDALPALIDRWPDLCVVHVGDVDAVAGEAAYRDEMEPSLQLVQENWRSLGTLDDAELAAFYRACAVTVLPSVNSTEAFGFVQVESMANGTPVVASALPGVRWAITETGMGLLIPVEGASELADAIAAILEDPDAYHRPLCSITALASIARSADSFEQILATLPGASATLPPKSGK